MGSKNSLFGGLVENSNEKKEPVNEEELHHSSTISSLHKTKRPRSRTNVLEKVAKNKIETEHKDGQYFDDINPEQCQIWHRQSRYFDLLDEKQCNDLISDFKGHIGQKIPIVIREIPQGIKKLNDDIRYEVIAGSRRLWSALYVKKNFNENFKLKVILKKLDDKQSAIECEKENDREELSAFERGMYYHRLLEQGVFDSQVQLSDSLNIPRTSLIELLEFGKIEKNIIELFHDPREIKKSWAKTLNSLCSNKTSKEAIFKKSENIKSSNVTHTSQKIFSLLQKVGNEAVEVKTTNKYEPINDEVIDPKTKRIVMTMERTRTNKIRVSIDNKITLSKDEILKKMDKFLNNCKNNTQK